MPVNGQLAIMMQMPKTVFFLIAVGSSPIQIRRYFLKPFNRFSVLPPLAGGRSPIFSPSNSAVTTHLNMMILINFLERKLYLHNVR